jgi:hypothetical protein
MKARVLSHEADALPTARNSGRHPEQVDGPGGRLEKARDEPQERRFTATAPADDGDDLVSNFEIDVVEDRTFVACADAVEGYRDRHVLTRC